MAWTGYLCLGGLLRTASWLRQLSKVFSQQTHTDRESVCFVFWSLQDVKGDEDLAHYLAVVVTYLGPATLGCRIYFFAPPLERVGRSLVHAVPAWWPRLAFWHTWWWTCLWCELCRLAYQGCWFQGLVVSNSSGRQKQQLLKGCLVVIFWQKRLLSFGN